MLSMQDTVRNQVFQQAQTLIIKIGSNVLTREDDLLDQDRIQALAEQIGRILDSGRRVVIVSSGAVAAGIGVLGLDRKPASLPELQASAAAGQMRLMKAWEFALGSRGRKIAQMLVTVNDFRHRRRYLNVRNTLRTLFHFDVVPVVNENDSVSIAEIALGDNDQLAAMIASLVTDPLLVILSAVDGLFDGAPGADESSLISLVEQPCDSLAKYAVDEQSSAGRGGMQSKLQAILNATSVGESVILANGRHDGVLDRIANGVEVGTLFLANGSAIPAWKRWIGYTTQPEGRLNLDDGALRAVVENGRSLLAVGITEVDGEFDQGACVELVSLERVIGRGLVNYSAADIRRIRGQKSAQIPEILGRVPYEEVIHRDNLVIRD